MVDDFAATLNSPYFTNTEWEEDPTNTEWNEPYATDFEDDPMTMVLDEDARDAERVARHERLVAQWAAVDEAQEARYVAGLARIRSAAPAPPSALGTFLRDVLKFCVTALFCAVICYVVLWSLLTLLGGLRDLFCFMGLDQQMRRMSRVCWRWLVRLWKKTAGAFTRAVAAMVRHYEDFRYGPVWAACRRGWNRLYDLVAKWWLGFLIVWVLFYLCMRATERFRAFSSRHFESQNVAFSRAENEKARRLAASTTSTWTEEDTPNAHLEATKTVSPWVPLTETWLLKIMEEEELTTSTSREITWPEDRETTTARAPRTTATTQSQDDGWEEVVPREQELRESHASIVASIRGEAIMKKAKEEEWRKLEERGMQEESNEAKRPKEQTKHLEAATGYEASKDSEEYDEEEWLKWTGFASWPSTIEERIFPSTIFGTAPQVTDLPSTPCTTVPPASPSSSLSTSTPTTTYGTTTGTITITIEVGEEATEAVRSTTGLTQGGSKSSVRSTLPTTTTTLFETETRYNTTTTTLTTTIEVGEEGCGEETAVRSEVITPEVWVGKLPREESATITLFQTTRLPPTPSHDRSTIIEVGEQATAVGSHAYEDQPAIGATMMEKGDDVHRNGRNLADGELAWCRECRQRHCCRVA
ncbi:hypothetical protein TI39_contig4265g00002 [Zymoseptoria brevis]|uniref:Transmembrane protein n=1 Tax=Zymoseptoria brevis TaxID=1047168 RepID=A0A0F4G8P9_9PEZI|nr:hypothetical protein TI39_contig4265g00002 [Zymoseptoria brevis]